MYQTLKSHLGDNGMGESSEGAPCLVTPMLHHKVSRDSMAVNDLCTCILIIKRHATYNQNEDLMVPHYPM